MKRSTAAIVCICMFLAVGAGTVRAEWEGNAGMAAASEFPLSGMYARSDMFPKNTIVEIRNLETEITVRAVITGSAGIPGLVAVLSPLTASALQIRTGSVSRVRISVPSPVSERPAPGTVSAGSALETADPDVNPAAAAASAAAVPPTAAVPAATPATESLSLSNLANTSEDPLVPVPAPAAPMVAAAEPVPAPVPAPVPVAAAEPVVPADTGTVDVSEPLPETPVASTEVVPAGSPVAAAIFIEEPSLEPAPLAEVPPAEAVPDLPSAEETALSAAAVYTAAEYSAAEYSATLEPAEPNPPVAPVAEIFLPVPVVGLSEPPAVLPVPEAAAIAAVPAAAVAVPGEPVRLPVIPSLARDSFYVQIATYSDPVNAKKLVDSYSKKYPVAVERTVTKGGEMLKVLIGPVKKDEFGAVLERFKSLGFKDAFVKKGQ